MLSESTEMIERLQRRHLDRSELRVLGNCNRLTFVEHAEPVALFWIEYCGSSQLLTWGFSSTIRAPRFRELNMMMSVVLVATSNIMRPINIAMLWQIVRIV